MSAFIKIPLLEPLTLPVIEIPFKHFLNETELFIKIPLLLLL